MTIIKSKKKAAFFLAALTVLSLYSIKNLSISCIPPSAWENFCVEFEWFGMDAEKIERTIAIPLEEKIRGLENLVSVSMVCEYSKCYANAIFYKEKKGARFPLCAAVRELSATLPKDVQKAKIYAAESQAKWIFCAAFDAKKFSKNELEKKLKSPLQSVNGVSQAIFSGGEGPEIQGEFDDGRLSQKKIFPWECAAAIREGSAKSLFESGLSYSHAIESAAQINAECENGGLVFAKEAFQKKDSIVRVNGRECVMVSLKSGSQNQNIPITREAKKILKKAFPQKDSYKIIYDNGSEQEKLLLKIFSAFVQSLAALALATAFFFRSAKMTAAAMAWTGFDLLFTAAILSALKIPLDSAAISGITISLGLLCDSALYMADDCKSSFGAMAAASLTTICAIVPIAALEPLAQGAKNLSAASGIAVGVSAALPFFFFPLFFQKKKNKEKPRNFLNLNTFLYKIPKNLIRLYPFLYIFPIILFFFMPKKIAFNEKPSHLFAMAEWPPEERALLIDQEVQDYVLQALKIKGVDFIQSEARRGAAELQIALKKGAKRERVYEELTRLSSRLSGSLYIPLEAPKRRLVQSVQISVLGHESAACKKIARAAAALLSKKDFVIKNKGQLVLNFKDDENVFVAKPRKNFLAQNGLSSQALAHALRWNVFGAVIQKIHGKNGIVDVRGGNKKFAFSEEADLEKLSSLKIQGLPLGALCSIERERKDAKIYRKDGMNAAHFTLELESKKSDGTLFKIQEALKEIELPEGYFFDFSREYKNIFQNTLTIFKAFLLALLAIYAIVAAQSERPLDALKVLLTIPVSLFLPLFFRAATFYPLSMGDGVGMVFVSGICVNNGIYILNEFNLRKRKDAFKAAKALSKSVFSSSITTMAGSIPLALLGGGTFAGDLAFFTLFGTLGSLAAAFFFFPQALTGFRPPCSWE